MSNEIKRVGLHTPIRRTEPDDIEAQIKALKQLQKQPAFMSKKPVSKKRDGRLNGWVNSLITGNRGLAYQITMVKKKWNYIAFLFLRHKRKP